MTDITQPPSDRLFVTCRPCNHTWIAAYLPMDAGLMAKIMKAVHCPKCGAPAKHILWASKEDALACFLAGDIK